MVFDEFKLEVVQAIHTFRWWIIGIIAFLILINVFMDSDPISNEEIIAQTKICKGAGMRADVSKWFDTVTKITCLPPRVSRY